MIQKAIHYIAVLAKCLKRVQLYLMLKNNLSKVLDFLNQTVKVITSQIKLTRHQKIIQMNH